MSETNPSARRTALPRAASAFAALALAACQAPQPSGTPLPPEISARSPAHGTGVTPASAIVIASGEPPSAAIAAAQDSGPCPSDMVLAGAVCIDRFEAPNERGKKPLRMQSADDGERHCQQLGKRLCTEDEWLRACEGTSGRPFPYGRRYQPGRCNDTGKFIAPSWRLLGGWPGAAAKQEAERLDQSEPSGARPECVSEEGAFDLTGNVAEWVVRTRDNETNHGHVVKGCFWGRCFRPPHTPSCEYVNFAHPGGYRSYEMGFRCCMKQRSGGS